MEETDFYIDHVTGPVVDAGYRVYQWLWQSRNNYGLPIERKNRRPREKLVSVWDTREEAQDEIVRLCSVPEP